jgi:hypothetical protein
MPDFKLHWMIQEKQGVVQANESADSYDGWRCYAVTTAKKTGVIEK